MPKYNRLTILKKIPFEVAVATSGGPDSMAVLDFLRKGGRQVHALYFNHGTPHGQEAETLVTSYCVTNNIPLTVGRIQRARPAGISAEEHWRNERYQFLESATTLPIITCHTLDDQVENWIFTCFHGQGRLIPYRRNQVIRPFLTTRKQALVGWCDRKHVPYLVDPGNSDCRYMRSLIRTRIVPEALRVNPGLHKVIKKKVLSCLRNNHENHL